jgi:hypothetical protein
VSGDPDDGSEGIRRRLLPYDVDAGSALRIGATHSADRPPNPPTYDQLTADGLVAPVDDPDRWFSEEEKHLAEWLRSRGVVVLSVQRRMGQRERTPDAVLGEGAATVELKHVVASVTAIVRAVRLGRGQSRRVVVDIRGPRADVGLALVAIRRAVRFYGSWLDEIVVVVNDDRSVGWTHGRDVGAV